VIDGVAEIENSLMSLSSSSRTSSKGVCRGC